MKKFLTSLSLLASTGTLLCCALPALLVALGAGGVLASVVSNVPQLVWLSEHKALTFGVAGVLLGFSAFAQWQARARACPVDASDEVKAACAQTRTWSGFALWISVTVFLVGSFFAFAPQVLGWV